MFYQIFPDRFATSARVEKPQNLEPWDSPPTTYGFKGGIWASSNTSTTSLTSALMRCISAPSFNPRRIIATTHDYYQVDPMLGGNGAFKILLDEAHRRGIRIVLDGVFNHASRGFYNSTIPWKTVRHRRTSTGSPFVRSRCMPTMMPVGGLPAWWNLKALPKFNHANPQVREFLFRVAEYWIEQGIDGWRGRRGN